ncbi:class I SAM-dependent DNA methyltransferase [Hydrogenophaga defluvii]|uniref:site-specific DNA-methyltransferase (adenine-specific) n=1 Tax=Hydrogenophaga defluvii TaxID=249410 RepID=A0ABW2SFK1_9BURK
MAKITTNELRKRLSAFAHQWAGASSERADEKLFTAQFLACFGVQPHQYSREYRLSMRDGSHGFMDGFIPGKVIIEGKSLGKDLKKARAQADEYRWACPPQDQPRYVLLHDFNQFVLFDLAQDKSHTCLLTDLSKRAEWFRFLVGDVAPQITEESEADRRAAEKMAALHEALLKSNFTGRDLEIFLTRLLFCLFADDTAIFGDNGLFRRLIEGTREDGKDVGSQLNELFAVLDTEPKKRSKLLDEDLKAFEYINGQLFSERSGIPAIDSTLRALLLECVRLDWSKISPAIFGAMFQGVLEQNADDQDEASGESESASQKKKQRGAKRRELGAHYTSERNILRAINPLFMDSLRAELESAGTSRLKLQALYDKLPTIRVFDPACGCGNFLVIAYRELRRLEMDLIDRLFSKGGQTKGLLDISTLIRVSVEQFFGIEIDESAAHIAQVAMWITDHQLNLEAADRFGNTRPSVPLVHSPHIRHGNALRLDWNTVLSPADCTFIVGNPPFVGAKFLKPAQRADVAHVMEGIPSFGLLDFVACWHVLAARYMRQNPLIRASLVSTNSICQGEQVGVLWSHLLEQGIQIHFAHRTFQWSNEGRGVAAVHCIIVGFGLQPAEQPRLFEYGSNIKAPEAQLQFVKRINPYLVDGPDVVLLRRSSPLSSVPEMGIGNKPIDDGNYLFTPEQKAEFIAAEPASAPFFRRWLGSEEFLNGIERWCLLLKDVSPNELAHLPECRKRIDAVRKFREKSDSRPTKALGATPRSFHVEFFPQGNYLVVPEVSSEKRRYIPIGFLDSTILASNLLKTVPDATLYHFGVLCSSAHNAWMRTVAGRMKSDYRYSVKIVYNNFPWPAQPTAKQRLAIETAAQAVLDARARYPDSSLAQLYNLSSMPAELVAAHAVLDKAVDSAYGYKGGHDDASRARYLFDQYLQATEEVIAPPPSAS